ncbi:coiled-coil domain-containing protein 180-like isoform X2 [Nerophis ophidion]|uniref:coiled-coil domain-containing protein 180-like isoform X2 n=1 Tax=Nerophis ophidion TaxID=159077 RepID=UPI002AE0845F|nr:coiled-coil domain-containing protein 180-like isoform X2 [Nerophis ophidion]
MESRVVPSGKVYQQLFGDQVRLSRGLLARRHSTATMCVSAMNTPCSRYTHAHTHARTHTEAEVPLSSSEWQQRGEEGDQDVEDVIRLPDTVGVSHVTCDILQRVHQHKRIKHQEVVRHMDAQLAQVAQACEIQVRTHSAQLLSALRRINERVDALQHHMRGAEQRDMQEVVRMWSQVEEELKKKKKMVADFQLQVSECEKQRVGKIRPVLRKYGHLLEKINFLPCADTHRQIHSEATMLNQTLLANRRSAARLLLLLQEANLQQEARLHLQWEESLGRWRRSRAEQVVQDFRSVLASVDVWQLLGDQPAFQEVAHSLRRLAQQRCDIIAGISALVPPLLSEALVSDWFSRLTAVNQHIDSCHSDFLHQLRCCYELVWRERLAQVQQHQEALSSLDLSAVEVADIVKSQLLTLIGQYQRQDEGQLTTIDTCSDGLWAASARLSRRVLVVMRALASLWEEHSAKLLRQEEDIQRRLDELRLAQEKHVQRKKVYLDEMLAGLRQESSEPALKKYLEQTVHYLSNLRESCGECVSDQRRVLDRLPHIFLAELDVYGGHLNDFFRLSHAFALTAEDLQKLPPVVDDNKDDVASATEGGTTAASPISSQSPAEPESSSDQLTEAQSSLLDLYDLSSKVAFTSSRGVSYSGPCFRCPASDLPANMSKQQEAHQSLFPVELLTHTLSRVRTSFMEHLEQRYHEVLTSVVTTVTERKEAVWAYHELQMQQLAPQHVRECIYLPRLAELRRHKHCVDAHCQEVSDVLASCTAALQQLQTSVDAKNQKLIATLSQMDDSVRKTDGSRRLETLSSTLQKCLDEYVKDTQLSNTAFRQMLHHKMDELRRKTAYLLHSFRLFSEGGDYTRIEVKIFQRYLKEESKRISVAEESVYADLHSLESKSLQQVKAVSGRFEEKLSMLQAEVKFMEKIQRILSSTQVEAKAETASSNQQEATISARLEEMRKILDEEKVCADEVCVLLSSVSVALKKRSHYLDEENAPAPAAPKPRKQVCSAPPPALLQPCRSGGNILEDPIVGVVKSLNRFSGGPEPPTAGPAPLTGRSSTHRQLSSRRSESAAVTRSFRTDRRFQIFGSKSEADQNPDCYMSIVNGVLRRTHHSLLLVAKDFYQSQRCGGFYLLPGGLDQWVDSIQQRLLGYHEHARTLLSASKEALEQQQCVLADIMRSLPDKLIRNHEQQMEAGLTEEAGLVRRKFDRMIAASEQEQEANVARLRVSLPDHQMEQLRRGEEDRQRRLHETVLRSHQQLQECVRRKGEEFVASLASLAENLLHHMDQLPLAELTSEDRPVTMETGQHPFRKWSGIPHLSADPSPCVPTATTAPVTTSKCTFGHVAVIEGRDAALQRFEQASTSEVTQSEAVTRRRLNELESWKTHWRQQTRPPAP